MSIKYPCRKEIRTEKNFLTCFELTYEHDEFEEIGKFCNCEGFWKKKNYEKAKKNVIVYYPKDGVNLRPGANWRKYYSQTDETTNSKQSDSLNRRLNLCCVHDTFSASKRQPREARWNVGRQAWLRWWKDGYLHHITDMVKVSKFLNFSNFVLYKRKVINLSRPWSTVVQQYTWCYTVILQKVFIFS